MPASPYRGRSNHGIRVTVSRDVDMKRKVDASLVIQSLPHPAAAAATTTTQQGQKGRKEERKGKKVVAPGSLAGAVSGAVRTILRNTRVLSELFVPGDQRPGRSAGGQARELLPSKPEWGPAAVHPPSIYQSAHGTAREAEEATTLSVAPDK
ncbi:uncharacterized protein LOC143689742 [Tamandua tetradactyla]|uniref:uncharacterized protein LOC143689742 n=1 Tax=Tamandua tetradactyla TaxID=48850 RepID=UPI004054828D